MPPPAVDAATAPDAGPIRNGDGGVAFTDAGTPGLSLEDADAGGCDDGEDNDGDGQTDCADPGCRTAPICCVGSLHEMCCSDEARRVSLTPTSCADGPASGCLDSGVVAFGGNSPVIEGGALVPVGMPAYAGVTLGPDVDVRGSRLSFSAVIQVPADRCSGCVDAAGIALVAPDDFNGALNYVRLAVLVIGATDEVALVVDGEVHDSTPLGDVTQTTVELSTGPDGALRYTLGDGTARPLPALALPAALTPTVLGQNENRAGEGAISVLSAVRDIHRCDVPNAIVTRADPVFPAFGSSYEPVGLGRLSPADDVDAMIRWGVIAVDGSLYAHQANTNGDFIPSDMADVDAGTPVLRGGAARYSAPWLEVTEGGFQLYYVETQANGATRLLRSFFTALEEGAAAPPTVLLEASMLGVERIGAATHVAFRGQELLIVEVEDSAGTYLQRFTGTEEGLSFSPAARVAEPGTDDLFAFDRDSVREPALVVDDNLLRLYYSGQRGTRRSIGLLVSSDGVFWRSLGEVLAPGGQSFDDLQVSAPAPLLEEDGIALYYLGRGGADHRIGVARGVGTMDE